jgi:Rieske Fe-S protein
MERKKFITACGLACIAGPAALSIFLQGCAGSRLVSGLIEGDELVVPVSEFEKLKKGITEFRKYIIVNHEKLQHPICVYRFTENDYNALLMKCTHQGNELTVYGDKLHCAAHGSEFNKSGMVTHGPAEQSLRTFPVTLENNHLKISLKAL